MKKLLVLNWKESQSIESAQELVSVVEDVSLMYNEYETILLPGDDLLDSLWFGPGFLPAQEWRTQFLLWSEDFSTSSHAPYCVLGHMSRRKNGETDSEIKEKLTQLLQTEGTPILCIGPVHPTDTLRDILDTQLAILDIFPRDRAIIFAYEPGFAVGTGQTMTLDDIEMIYVILSNMLASFTNKYILYGGSVNAGNIADIMRLTDGVIVGKASQEKISLLSLYIALGES